MICITSICVHCVTEFRCVLPQYSFMSFSLHKQSQASLFQTHCQPAKSTHTCTLIRLPFHVSYVPFHTAHNISHLSYCLAFTFISYFYFLSYSCIHIFTFHFIQYISLTFRFIQHITFIFLISLTFTFSFSFHFIFLHTHSLHSISYHTYHIILLIMSCIHIHFIFISFHFHFISYSCIHIHFIPYNAAHNISHIISFPFHVIILCHHTYSISFLNVVTHMFINSHFSCMKIHNHIIINGKILCHAHKAVPVFKCTHHTCLSYSFFGTPYTFKIRTHAGVIEKKLHTAQQLLIFSTKEGFYH